MPPRSLLMLTFICLFVSCSDSEPVEKYEYFKFRKQITPSGKYVIYDYARYGPMAFSSDIYGTELFKVGEKFVEGKGKKINGELSEWLSNDTILIYNFKSDLKQPKDTLPINTTHYRLGDFVVKEIFYKSNASGADTYKFDSVSTTNDSVFLQVVSKKDKRQILRFPLGGTTIQTKSNSITKIEVAGRIYKGIDFVYKNEDGSFSTGLPEIGNTWIEFTPTKQISPKPLKRTKIFWAE